MMPVNLNYVAAEAETMDRLQRAAILGPWKEGVSAGSVVSSVSHEPDVAAEAFYGGQVVCESAGEPERNLMIFARGTQLPRMVHELVDRVRELETACQWLREQRSKETMTVPYEKPSKAQALAQKFEKRLDEILNRIGLISETREGFFHLRDKTSWLEGVVEGLDRRLKEMEKRLDADEKRIGALYVRLASPGEMEYNEKPAEKPAESDSPDYQVIGPMMEMSTPERDIRAEVRAWIRRIQTDIDAGTITRQTRLELQHWMKTVRKEDVPLILRQVDKLIEKEKGHAEENKE